jgi:miniconductance mechanosensitive channel
MIEAIQNFLVGQGLGERLALILGRALILFGVFLLSWLANFITKKVIVRCVCFVIERTQLKWDDFLVQRKVFNRLAYLAPAVVIHLTAPFAFSWSAELEKLVEQIVLAYIVFIIIRVLDSLLDVVNDIYSTFEIARTKPIKVHLQVANVILYLLGVIFIISILLDKSPWKLLGGLGAMMAVILLAFKDTILGFVASIQLSANDMVRPGDWIEMPKYGADGDVIDVSLTTVKVQNWDKTITTIPTYYLISDSFKNWRGMQESGGRRIKRSLYIDMHSIKLCTPEMLERFSKYRYISDYLASKKQAIGEFNTKHGFDDSNRVNGRRLTNIGTFRAYVVEYLRHHPMIHQNMTFLVRHLQPTENGLPIEIYVFSKDKVWANYEAIQADIFDHILAVVPEFELRVFQNPTGADFRRFVGSGAGDSFEAVPAVLTDQKAQKGKQTV